MTVKGDCQVERKRLVTYDLQWTNSSEHWTLHGFYPVFLLMASGFMVLFKSAPFITGFQTLGQAVLSIRVCQFSSDFCTGKALARSLFSHFPHVEWTHSCTGYEGGGVVCCGLKNMPYFGWGYGSVFKEIAIQVGGLEFRSPEPTKMSNRHCYPSILSAHGRWT